MSDELTLFAEDILASLLVTPGSERAQKMTVTSGRKCIGSWVNSGPLGSLERMLLGTSAWASTLCFLTWMPSATPAGRLLFRLAPSEPLTGESGSGLLPTPAARDCKGSPVGPSLRQAMARGVSLEETLLREMLPTPSAGNRHSAGRLDEWGGQNKFRARDIGRLHLNPSWALYTSENTDK